LASYADGLEVRASERFSRIVTRGDAVTVDKLWMNGASTRFFGGYNI
jgi:hypothetical protein